MGKVVTLKDKNGENVYPSTFSTLIYDNNGKSVDSALDGLRSNISTNTSDEGKSIVINDCCNHGKLSIDVKGNSFQNGTPTPKTPVGIISCDNPTLYVSGKNLFNLNNVMATTYPRSGVKDSLLLNNSEILFTTIRNDVYYGTVFSIGNTPVHPDIILTSVSPNTTYLFYLSNQELNKNFVSFFDSDKIAITPYTEFKTSQFSFTTPSDCYYVHIRFGKGDAVVGQTYSTKIMFMQGDKITDFEFYKEPQTLKIPYVLRGIGDVKDEIIIREDGSGQLIQNIYNVQNVKSTGDIQKDTSKTNTDLIYFNIDAPLAKASTFSQIECYSNKFAWENKNIWAMDACGMDIYTSSNNKTRILLRIEKNDDINTILENGLTIQYILAEPIISELTIDEINCIFKTYSPTTTIYSDSNADLMATYEISTNNYFQNKLAELKIKLGGV
ncbi:hypothetical protein [uncultured Eubacterium sp.]|uniref:hypothetical protein n=1 Tax=uncultured Eubacterium sp. TaxID=165185 RepID=UPI002599299F|nr:hypothetical protein [uncultured Eubacterium sp.]